MTTTTTTTIPADVFTINGNGDRIFNYSIIMPILNNDTDELSKIARNYWSKTIAITTDNDAAATAVVIPTSAVAIFNSQVENTTNCSSSSSSSSSNIRRILSHRKEPLDFQNRSLLHLAIGLKAKYDVLRSLIKLFACNVNSQNNEGVTPILLALRNKDYFHCNELFRLGADIFIKDSKGQNYFSEAHNNYIDHTGSKLARQLRLRKVPPFVYKNYYKKSNNDSSSAAAAAIENDDLKLAKIFVDVGWTIASAANLCRSEILRIMLDLGCNVDDYEILPNVPCIRRTALHQAIENCDEESVKLLLNRNADISLKTKYGDTALSLAFHDYKIFKIFVNHFGGQKVCDMAFFDHSHDDDDEDSATNAKGLDYKRPAAIYENFWDTDILIWQHILENYRVNLDRQDSHGNSLIQSLIHRRDIAYYLESLYVLKFDVDHRNKLTGMTLLHEAARRGNLMSIKLLLYKGANARVYNDSDKTPLELLLFSPFVNDLCLEALLNKSDPSPRHRSYNEHVYKAGGRNNLSSMMISDELIFFILRHVLQIDRRFIRLNKLHSLKPFFKRLAVVIFVKLNGINLYGQQQQQQQQEKDENLAWIKKKYEQLSNWTLATEYLVKCNEELEKLHKAQFYNEYCPSAAGNGNLLQLLTFPLNNLAARMRNFFTRHPLVNFLNGEQSKKDFPIYHDWLKRRFEEAIEEDKLRNNAFKILSSTIPQLHNNYLLIEYIIDYLDRETLLSLNNNNNNKNNKSSGLINYRFVKF